MLRLPAGDASDGRRHPRDAQIDAGKGVPQVLQQGRRAQISEAPAVRGAVPEHLREGFPGENEQLREWFPRDLIAAELRCQPLWFRAGCACVWRDEKVFL